MIEQLSIELERPARVRRVTFERRLREWAWLEVNGYQGFRRCRCGEVRHCRGKSYERQRCRDCFLRGA